MNNISIETKAISFLSMVIVDFIRRSLVVEVNKILEENIKGKWVSTSCTQQIIPNGLGQCEWISTIYGE